MFPFPSNGKGHCKSGREDRSRYDRRFQFPSNGKGHCKVRQTLLSKPNNWVSIPFKRERTLQGEPPEVVISWYERIVSIPFKRERTLQEGFDAGAKRVWNRGFNSLQTGKDIASDYWSPKIKLNFCFNSLQTGKDIASSSQYVKDSWVCCVSIPFKRERTLQENT